jgi:hypothetical protein
MRSVVEWFDHLTANAKVAIQSWFSPSILLLVHGIRGAADEGVLIKLPHFF